MKLPVNQTPALLKSSSFRYQEPRTKCVPPKLGAEKNPKELEGHKGAMAWTLELGRM